MPTYKAVWTGTETALESAAIFLTDVLFPPANAVSLTKHDDAAADDATLWKLEAYFTTRPDEGVLATLLAETGVGAPVIEELPDIDWVAHALEGLGLVEAGRFVLYGSHDADNLPVRDEQNSHSHRRQSGVWHRPPSDDGRMPDAARPFCGRAAGGRV